MNKSTFRKLIVVLCVAISILLVVCACGEGDVTPETTPAPETTAAPVETTAADTTAEDTTVADTTAEDTTVADTTAEDTTAEDTTAEDTTAEDTTPAEKFTYIVKVTDEKDRNLEGVTVQFCVGDVCQLPQTTNAVGVVMIELEKADYTVKVTLEGYSGEESYTFPEGSYTLNVTLTNNNPEPETTPAPETTPEPETTAALPEPETFAPGVETEIVDEQVVLSAFEGATMPYNVVGAQRTGMQFNVGRTPLSQITVAKMATFACSVNEWTVKIYAWNANYETTVAGTPLYETAGTNHSDSTDFTVAIPADVVITGEVLVVIENLNPGTLNESTGVTEGNSVAMTGWVGGTPVAGYVCYLEGMSTANVFAASIVVKKTVAVDPNAPVVPEFETAPYDKDYFAAKGAEIIGFQWIQYLVDEIQMVQAWGYMGADEKSMVNFDGTPAEGDPYVIAEGSSTFGYYGWLGVGDTQAEPGIFGYSIDGAEAVYGAAFTTSPHNQGVWDAGMNLDAVSVPDIRVTVPLTDLYGYHQIQIFYKSAADVVVQLDCILVFIEGEPETDPVETDPVETDPVETDPVETDPVETDPVETDPVETDPVETDPVETDPVETDPVLGSEQNPIFPEFTWNDEQTEATATVTAPVGTTYYAVNGGGGMLLSINGGEPITLVAAGIGRVPAIFSITNEGDAEAEYTLKLTYPVGSMMNPEVIEDMSNYWGEVSQAAGNSQGYFYTYTATADGTITAYFGYEGYPEGYECDIILYNLTTYEQKTLLTDGVDNYGLEVSIDVQAGDQIQIIVAAVEDAEGNWYPAADMTWCGSFAAPAGTVDNPIRPEWSWDEGYVNATASVTVAAGQTVYFNGISGMILTIDGDPADMNEMGVFTITNEGDEEATYALALATPVGANENPEVIEALPFTDENSLAEEEAYCYIWTATEDAIIVLTVTDGANVSVNNLSTYEYLELAEIEYDDDWNASWVVAEKLEIAVAAGQQLKIQVNALTDWENLTAPAIDYTLNIAKDESEEPETNEPETNEPETNEPETNEPETDPVEPETNLYDKTYAEARGAEILGFQWVQYLVDGIQVYGAWGDGGKYVYSLATNAPVTDPTLVLAAGTQSFSFYGWIGVADSAENPGMFGYSIDGAAIVFNASFTTGPNNEGANAITGGVTSPDFRINADLTGLSGNVTVQYFYKSAAGVVVLLDTVELFIPATAEYDMTFAEALNTEVFGIQWSQYKVDGVQTYQAWAGTNQSVTDFAQQPVATPLALAAGTQTFGYYGWIGVADDYVNDPGVFGYAIDDGDIVYNETFIWINPDTGTYEYNNQGALTQFLQGATTAPTFDIVADVSGLTGLHSAQFFYQTVDGTVILLDSIMINIG